MSQLFTTFKLREITFRNRIFVSPMCQYSSIEGMPTDWHFVHLGSRAVGGAALVMVEASAVCPEGRISPFDSGLWSDAQSSCVQTDRDLHQETGRGCGDSAGDAGRKGSTDAPWKGERVVPPSEGGWQPVAPRRHSVLAEKSGSSRNISRRHRTNGGQLRAGRPTCC